MLPLENDDHDDCENLQSTQLVSAAVSLVRVVIPRNKVVKSWEEVQKLFSLKLS